ncbi:MAG: TatD family hydrolase [Tannerella sp.]|jgi:TatD DNase family protein|nr:TatD family hydrolase [Tannerella sp.]
MNIIDTHTHIYSNEFDGDRSEIIRFSKTAGIKSVLLPNEDSGSIDAINKLCDKEPGFAYPMMGLHPTSVNENYIKEIRAIESALAKRKYYAIGETGIDLYWDKRFLKEQKTVFEEQLHWSIDMQLPIVIHMRDSFNEVMECLHRVGADRLRGVFHCFGGTTEEWKEISKLSSFYVGIGGIITFKNNILHDTIKQIPLERVVLETDAPYLAPVPYRGKRNEPRYIIETAKKAAEYYKMTIEEIAMSTYQNALNLFNIPVNNIEVEAF